jgi:hypothetical protein
MEQPLERTASSNETSGRGVVHSRDDSEEDTVDQQPNGTYADQIRAPRGGALASEKLPSGCGLRGTDGSPKEIFVANQQPVSRH